MGLIVPRPILLIYSISNYKIKYGIFKSRWVSSDLQLVQGQERSLQDARAEAVREYLQL